MGATNTAFVHYSAPPVAGGVEAVIEAHTRVFLDNGYPVTIVAGQGDHSALPGGAALALIPEMDSQHPEILAITETLEQGVVPETFGPMVERLVAQLRPVLRPAGSVIIHNVLTKHFNLPLTAALVRLLDEGSLNQCIAWSHDITWTSEHSNHKVFSGYPWDLLRTCHPGVKYVAISEQRQAELAGLFNRSCEEIEVIYNGVDPCVWFGLTPAGWDLVRHLDLLSGDIIMLMPVRITQAKNIELAAQVLAEIKTYGIRPRLVITGPPDPHDHASMEYSQTLMDLRASLGLIEEMRFVFESDPHADDPYLISQTVVADILRVSDLVFIPSHREGFGMPVLEAGLIGIPVFSSSRVPAAMEIGGKNVYLFDPSESPDKIARLIHKEIAGSRAWRFRRKVRQTLTWEQLFIQRIEPLLSKMKK